MESITNTATTAANPTTAPGVSVTLCSPALAASGFTDEKNRPMQAVFSCLACGEALNADLNAALVIRDRGVAQLGPGTQGDWTKQADTVPTEPSRGDVNLQTALFR